ncbi:hypothetical protein [Virgibacillus halodenitrificans]|nr:hypothetical protein [Virgibacillus halodenitrificans]
MMIIIGIIIAFTLISIEVQFKRLTKTHATIAELLKEKVHSSK